MSVTATRPSPRDATCGALADREPLDPGRRVEVVAGHRVVLDVDDDRRTALDDHATRLHQVVEGPQPLAVSVDRHGTPELLGNGQVPVAGGRRVVGVVPGGDHRGLPGGGVDLQHAVGALAGDEHRASAGDDLEMTGAGRQREVALGPQRLGVEHQQPVGLAQRHRQRPADRVVDQALWLAAYLGDVPCGRHGELGSRVGLGGATLLGLCAGPAAPREGRHEYGDGQRRPGATPAWLGAHGPKCRAVGQTTGLSCGERPQIQHSNQTRSSHSECVSSWLV